MKYFLFSAISLIILFSSCEKKLDIDIPDSEKHIVMNGLNSPDSLISVTVSKSQNALDNDPINYLTNATVKIYRHDLYLEDLVHIGDGVYESSFFPEINETYEVRAEFDDLEPVRSEFKLLPAVPIFSLDTAIESELYDYGDGEVYTEYQLHYSVSIDDNENTSDYYFLSLSRLVPYYDFENYTEPVFLGYYEEFDYFNTNDPVLRDYNTFSLNGMIGMIFSDELFNGTNYELDVNTSLSYGGEFKKKDFPDPVYTVVKLLTVNEDIFRYIVSYNLNEQSEFDPFAQPVQIFTNVENGLGLFSGYTMYADTLELNSSFGGF